MLSNESKQAITEHRPAREGFNSRHPGVMHACGHDGHTTIGIGIARELDEHGGFDGHLKLFFQPAEEGGRGGYPMSKTDHLEDIEHFLALHLGLDNETGKVIAAYERPLSNAKLDVTFTEKVLTLGKHQIKDEMHCKQQRQRFKTCMDPTA